MSVPSTTAPSGATPAGALTRSRDRRPAGWLAVAASVAVIILEAWDAFTISQPLGAIIAIVLFAAGILWWRLRGGRAPAIYLGVLFALEIIGNFTIFGVLGDLRHEGSWAEFANGVGYTVATVAGLVACLVLTAAPLRQDRS
jgi:hypothetical protein